MIYERIAIGIPILIIITGLVLLIAGIERPIGDNLAELAGFALMIAGTATSTLILITPKSWSTRATLDKEIESCREAKKRYQEKTEYAINFKEAICEVAAKNAGITKENIEKQLKQRNDAEQD